MTEEEYANISITLVISNTTYHFNNGFYADISLDKNTKAGEIIGNIIISAEDKLLAKIPVILISDVTRKNFNDFLKDVFYELIWTTFC